jgi:hypothetical protein
LWQLLTAGLPERPCAAIKFDRNPGRRPHFQVISLAGKPFGALPAAFRKPRPLQDIAAVQVTAAVGDRPDRPAPGAGLPNPPALGAGLLTPPAPTCRLQLLLRDTRHPLVELAPHADLAWARETGERLARFLGVPLVDRIQNAGGR